MKHYTILILIAIAVALPILVIGFLGIFQVPTTPLRSMPRPESGRLYGLDRDGGTATRPLIPSGSVVGDQRIVSVTVRSYKFQPSPIVVRQGENVRLEATSKDITHNIEIPKLGINQTLEPMKTEIITFQAQKPGRYVMACSVNCGLGTENLEGLIVIIPKPKAEDKNHKESQDR
jgi:heme/copper-type cytochrome/quinol oxidase subunit 2